VPAPYGRRPRWRRPLTVLTVIAVLLAGAGYAAYSAYQHYVVRLLTVPGCQAGHGNNAIPLDFGQAADAAIIAGVAVRENLPRQALTVAYATALQESKLENPGFGDLDSVGIFQQRPSQGWGSATQLQDPAFATTAFFNALTKVPNWSKMPVYKAAQAVQRSADGYAYQQYAQTGALLAADYTAALHAVTCWYDPAAQASSLGVSTKPNFGGALKGLTDAFGPVQAGGAVRAVTAQPASGTHTLKVTRASGWPVANWLVANAGNYGITQVRYRGFRWKAGLTETSWQADPGGPAGSIVAS
jgi:hypothetical protein